MMKRSWTRATLAATVVLLMPVASAHAVFLEFDEYDPIGVTMELTGPFGVTEAVNLTGDLTFVVTFPTTEGSASDSDGDGRDQVPTEMLALSLTGNSSMGLVAVNLNPGMASMGSIEEQTDFNTGLLDVFPFFVPPGSPPGADSFFNVFFEITVNGSVLHNIDPARISGVIHEKPPPVPVMADILGSFPQVRLFDPANNPTGLFVAGAGGFAVPAAVPEPGTLALFAVGLIGLGTMRRRRQKN